MGQLVQEAIAGLSNIKAVGENLNDSIWIAGDLLARFHTDGGFKSGFEHIDAETITDEDAEYLKQALLNALKECDDLATKGSLLDALKRARDTELKPLYEAYLEEALRALEGSSCVIYACLDCLGYLGEDVYEWDENYGTSQSIDDLEKNRRQARSYLQKLYPQMMMPFPFGPKFPKDK